MSCCITSRQLHNSPIYTPSFASGRIHTFSHVAQLAQNKQRQQTQPGDTFPFDLCCLLMTSDLGFFFFFFCQRRWQRQNENNARVMMSLLEGRVCCSSKTHVNEPDREGNKFSVESSTSHLFAPQAPCMCLSSAVCICVCFVAEAPVSKSGQGYSGAPRIQRQEQVIHLSPKKGSQV